MSQSSMRADMHGSISHLMYRLTLPEPGGEVNADLEPHARASIRWTEANLCARPRAERYRL